MTGKTSLTIYSWDTCVMLALLKNEHDKPVEMIEAIAADVETGKARLVVSTIVLAELLDVIDSPELSVSVDEFFRLPSVQVVDVNRTVAKRAAQLRWQWKSLKNGNLKVPDAVILATAQLSEAEHLHSFDNDLLRFDGTPLANGVKLCCPRFVNGQQVLRVNHSGDSRAENCNFHRRIPNGTCTWGRPASQAEFSPRTLLTIR